MQEHWFCSKCVYLLGELVQPRYSDYIFGAKGVCASDVYGMHACAVSKHQDEKQICFYSILLKVQQLH